MEQLPVQDAFEQQYINETLDLMRKLNEKYADFYHFKVLTIVPMKEDACDKCKELAISKCLRLVVSGHAMYCEGAGHLEKIVSMHHCSDETDNMSTILAKHKCGPDNITEQLMDQYAPVKGDS